MMNFKSKAIIFTIVAFAITQPAIAQKIFQTTIQLPRYVDSKKVSIRYDNGKDIVKVTNSFINNKITVIGKSYTNYVSLEIHYLNDIGQSLFNNNYFLEYPSSSIKFTDTVWNDSLKSPFGDCLLVNALDVEKTKDAKKEALFTKEERTDIDNFLRKNKNEIDKNDSLKSILQFKIISYYKKELEFVEKNANSRYAIWSFKKRLIPAFINSEPMLLEDVFNKAFPKNFRQSVEGEEIKKVFDGINITKKGFYAPWVTSKDIKGNIINLKNYRGKYVLIQLWASWCGPCIAEIPVMKKIRDDYNEDQLQMIGITYDTNYKDFYNAVSQYKLNWTQIFNNNNLRKIYGNKPIPSVYLVDKEGKIVFSSWEDNMETLELLLKEKLQKN